MNINTKWCSISLAIICALSFNSCKKEEVKINNCISLDGVNDYIELGNIYDNVGFPITVSAWVKMDLTATGRSPIFVSQDSSALYNGFNLISSPTSVGIEYGDGLGENSSVYRRGKGATVLSILGSWTHVVGVIRSATDMDLYVDGVDVSGEYGGTSSNPMGYLPTDLARIGREHSNGVAYFFKGQVDEVQIWNKSLSAAEVSGLADHKITGNEIGLIGYWNFNESSGMTVKDKSPNHFDGTLKNGPTRLPSPIH